MHPNPAFRHTSRQNNLAFARARGFGVLAVSGGAEGAQDAGPLMSHVPFLLDEVGRSLDLHLVRSNPIARLLRRGAVPARIAVSGPDGYVSPDWYGVPDQVPTWNYVAVHITGTLELRPDAELPLLLARQSADQEARLAPKIPWSLEKMTPEALEKMMRMIVPVRLRVGQVEGTWKLSQNKPAAARLGAALGLEEAGLWELGELIQNPPE